MRFVDVLFFVKYPKVYALAICIAVATVFYWNAWILGALNNLGVWAYVFSFLSGLIFPIGVIGPFSAGYFGLVVPENIFLAALFSGFGAAVTDTFVFGFVRRTVKEKASLAKKGKLVGIIGRVLAHPVGARLLPIISFVMAAVVIAVPFPNKTDAVLISGLVHLKRWQVAVLSFVSYFVLALFFMGIKYAWPVAMKLLGFT